MCWCVFKDANPFTQHLILQQNSITAPVPARVLLIVAGADQLACIRRVMPGRGISAMIYLEVEVNLQRFNITLGQSKFLLK